MENVTLTGVVSFEYKEVTHKQRRSVMHGINAYKFTQVDDINLTHPKGVGEQCVTIHSAKLTTTVKGTTLNVNYRLRLEKVFTDGTIRGAALLLRRVQDEFAHFVMLLIETEVHDLEEEHYMHWPQEPEIFGN